MLARGLRAAGGWATVLTRGQRAAGGDVEGGGWLDGAAATGPRRVSGRLHGAWVVGYHAGMEYVITFLEGILSFISPCTLPLLPVYIVYLTGGQSGMDGTIAGSTGADDMKKQPLRWARPLGFVLGFTVVFCLLGLFAGALGTLFVRHQRMVDLVCGLVVIVFGLVYLGVIPVRFLRGVEQRGEIRSFFSAMVFGAIYSVSLTPCVGAFLGSAIMLAAASGTMVKGTLLLLVYSLGMGLPFLLSALLIEQLTGAFSWIKQHYNVIDKVCGLFLIVVGICMACGLLNKLISLLA